MAGRAPKTLPGRVLAALWGCLALAACGGSDADPGRRPDVVLIVIDTLRADHLSSYGYPRPTTPALDRLAAEGTRFADTTSQSAWTLPSMVSLFSGRYLSAYRDFPDPKAPALAEVFHGAGYRTVGVVGNVLLRPEAGFGRGFDHYDARPGTQPPGDDRVRARSIDELAEALAGPLDEALAPGPDGGRPPLFLYLHPFDPHAPYAGSPELDAELPPAGAPPVEPPTWQAEALAALGPRPPAGEADWSRELAELRRRRGLYDQDVRLTDDALGRILLDLERRGVLAHAVVAVLSDHGECLYERLGPMQRERLRGEPPATFFYQDHGAYLYEEAVRTPLILWGAGVPAGRTVQAPVENVDLFPTLLELCGVPARGELHGRSLVPLLAGDAPAGWRATVHSHVLFSTSVREVQSGLKLIVPTEQGQKVGVPIELLRLPDDPRELRPIEDAAERARLAALLAAWQQRYPTESTFGQKPDEVGIKMLHDLGYTDTHTGR